MAGSTIEARLTERLLAGKPSRYAPWFDRAPCLAAIERDGLPAPRSESWRHTNVRRWYETVLANGDSSEAGEIRITAPPGVEVKAFSDLGADQLALPFLGEDFDWSSAPLAAVNGLLLGAGVIIRARGQHREPVHIESLGADFQQVLLVVEPNATLTAIEEPAPFTHRLVEGVVGRGARLDHWRRQAVAPSRECSLVRVRLAAHARYTLAQGSRGADLRRNDIRITLAGEGAEASVHGAWRVGGRSHLDNQVTMSHAVGGGFSRQIYRGVAAGRAHAILNGRIHIAPGADRTDASLTAKNLLASNEAQVFAKPELEIHASDVKCGHGATVGTLDDLAIHYLRSRGIAHDDARELLLRGFLREAITDTDGARALGLVP